ncbi:MAG: hypothetical protein D3909_05955, partial [Candidatus Electrothrix sp. ATG1]|nr:hypothetical protein [Candidatus Electrothrix sp. ATG1]
MKKVISPIKPKDTGKEVANLQAVLLVLIDKKDISLGRDTASLKKSLTWERRRKTYGVATANIVSIFQKKHKIIARNRVNEATATAMNKLLEDWGLIKTFPALAPHISGNHPVSKKYLVQGKVLQADGTPLQGVQVRAFFKKLRSEDRVDKDIAITDRLGKYSILYSVSSNNTEINLIIRVVDQQGNQLASSATLFNAKPSETVDIQIAETTKQPDSKYERITRTLQPLLLERPIRELREDDEDNPEKDKFKELSYLAGETGIAADQLSLMVAAEKMGHSNNVSPKIFYGLLRKGLPADLYALGEQGRKKVEKTLREAVEEQLLPASVPIEKELEKLFNRPEIKLVNKPLFLARPEILFTSLADRNTLKKKEQYLIDAKL